MTEKDLLNKLNIAICAKCLVQVGDTYYGDSEFKLCINCYTMLPKHDPNLGQYWGLMPTIISGTSVPLSTLEFNGFTTYE